MAEYSGFFNSVGGDRSYTADFFAKLFGSFIGNGVFPNPSTGLQVIANDNMTVTYKAGQGWINGYYYENDSDTIIPIAASDGLLKRIDRIVLRYSTAGRNILMDLKPGTLASSPVTPALHRNADIYELGIADIYVGNGAVSISQGNITDLRLNSSYCGIVHGLVNQADTTTIFNQYLSKYYEIANLVDADIADLKSGFQSSWNVWFSGIQDVLDGDTAGNLYNLIFDNTTDISTNVTNIATNAADIIITNKKILNQNRKMRGVM